VNALVNQQQGDKVTREFGRAGEDFMRFPVIQCFIHSGMLNNLGTMATGMCYMKNTSLCLNSLYQHFGGTYCLHLQGWFLPASAHGVTTHKTNCGIIVRNTNISVFTSNGQVHSTVQRVTVCWLTNSMEQSPS
jgi:hypothetical protein